MKNVNKLFWSKKNILIVIIVITATFFFVQKNLSQASDKIETTKVKQGDIQEELILSGEIDAGEKVTLRFQTSGRLSYVGVKTGQWVNRGQVIASLDRRELQKKLKKELNTFVNERYDFDQTKDDNKDKALTDAIRRTLDKSQNDLNNAIIDVELQKIALDFATLITPISGTVTNVTSPIAGVNITPSQAEFEIINPNSLLFVATADQTEVTKLSDGLFSDISLDSYPDESLAGSVKRVSFTPKTGETGAVYEIEVAIDSPRLIKKLRLGMTGDISFITRKSENTFYLPIEFVKFTGSKPFVYVRQNNKIVKKTVTTGIETEDKIEITSKLKKGDIVYDKAR
ncbi:hypothetical protein A2690_04220 [Candidatus Roizmanbacteria bacterium RIFCSPHIGHO2_01_FULL_39_12b]|uniref:Multidrug resistance protein MdtA-like barrel-sandwich hybrid domain-containing protein n=1 Tax=Candidatus Roizmanbacteria bacterium RIFCSPHIGHO2_01_FULL_39_12b TaxID=1802030 RepID=A0A1F7GCE0_9BACT|nr:MAG: hypothetical protein A2690_04220 [Candidatus Roizmanbacteria bacterium RIFCSPHIGHO2_01_FULL_39_12b]OGK47147.1 MAG: hypothetical protein A3B46_01945 [Candidatus Roizmanbacteria bacterium RIFCSPLOWO2_01_FULL_39_19]